MTITELTKKWLSLFDDPGVFLLPDVKSAKSVDYSIGYSAEAVMGINDSQPYGAFFTPNGRLGKKNAPGQKIVRKTSEAQKHVSAFYVDIDIKDTEFSTPEDLLAHVLEVAHAQRVPVSYITRSGGGFHLYMFVNKADRQQAGTLNYTGIQKNLAQMFSGDESNSTIERLIRLPFGNHWKSGLPIQMKLYRAFHEPDGIELSEVTEESDIEFPEYVSYSYESLKNLSINASEDNGKITTSITLSGSSAGSLKLSAQNDIDTVNRIPVATVLEKLGAYPREYNGSHYLFVPNGQFIRIRKIDVETGEILGEELTDGYRINVRDNYVNNFTVSQHPIEERPRGEVYAFLYHYFNKDTEKVREFLQEAFSIKLFEKLDTAKNVMAPLKTANGTMFFTDKGVKYRLEAVNDKGKLIVREVSLFDVPLIVEGVLDTNYTMKGEMDTPVKAYYVKRMDKPNDAGQLIFFHSTKTKFNDAYGVLGLAFVGKDDLYLLDFYNALNAAVEAGQVKRMELVYLNGFHEKFFIMGDKVIHPDFKVTDSIPDAVMRTQHIECSFHDKAYMTCREFCDGLRRSYSDRVSLLSFLGFITVFLGERFWKELRSYKQQFMIPGLMVSGKTRVGKSTLISMLKEGACLTNDTRKLSVLSTSPQPLKQAATDNFILHLDEFTGVIHPDKESIIRDTINKAKSSRGLQNGSNVDYVYRAGLVVDGERLPQSASVVNRMVVCAMFEFDKKGDERTLYAMKNAAYLKDLLAKAYSFTSHDVAEYYRMAEDQLAQRGLTGRNLVLFSYLLAVSEMFDIASEDEVVRIIEENFSIMSEGGETEDLSDFLSFCILERRIIPTMSIGDTYNVTEITIPLTQGILQEKQIDIVGILRKYGGKVRMHAGKMLITVHDEDKALRAAVSGYQQYFKA